MAAVQRLHPRHWDGHRLLQFLTGLALLVLAFGTTAASASPVATTVEAPAAAPVVAGGDGASAQPRPARHSDECQHDASRVARAMPPAPAAAAPAAVDAPDVGAAAPAAAAAAPAAADTSAQAPEVPVGAAAPVRAAVARFAAGIAQRAHGSRAPPR